MTHQCELERYTEPCSDCGGHSAARIVCSCGWQQDLTQNYASSIGYDLDYRLKRMEHLLGVR